MQNGRVIKTNRNAREKDRIRKEKLKKKKKEMEGEMEVHGQEEEQGETWRSLLHKQFQHNFLVPVSPAPLLFDKFVSSSQAPFSPAVADTH